MATLLLRGQPIGSIHGVLFDKDGTLSHSEPHLLDLFERRLTVICDLWRETKGASHLSELNITFRQAFGIRDKALHPGGTLAVAARQDNLTSTATVFCIFGCSWPEALALAETCFQRIDQQFSDDGSSRPLLDGAKRFLEDLDKAAIPSAVISNDTTKGIHTFLDHENISSLVVDCWSADDQPRKPNPEAVHQLCKRLQLLPHQCALIGDAETDLQMARDAGIGCVIGYLGGWEIRPDLPTAVHQFEHWNELELEADP